MDKQQSRIKFLQDNVEYFANLLGVATDMAAGKSQKQACKDHNIDYIAYNRLIGKEHLGYQSSLCNPEDLSSSISNSDLRLYLLTWQENLWLSVFGETMLSQIPPDINEGVNEALHSPGINERDRKIILMRYKEGMTLQECGKAIGVTQERVRQGEARALRKLRHPSRAHLFRYGNDYRHKLKELRNIESGKVISPKIKEISERIEAARQTMDKEALLKLQNELNQAFEEAGIATGEQDEACYGFLDTNIAELELSIRSYNCLHRAGINTFRDLAGKNVRDLSKIRNLGAHSLREIVKVCARHGITIQGSEL